MLSTTQTETEAVVALVCAHCSAPGDVDVLLRISSVDSLKNTAYRGLKPEDCGVCPSCFDRSNKPGYEDEQDAINAKLSKDF